jgi:isopropylmalate/homocitrate/citramalate synthase
MDKMSGKFTVKQKLEEMNLDSEPENVQKLFNYAKLKEKGRVTENEISEIFSNYQNIDMMIR